MKEILKSSQIVTPLGPMIAVGSNEALYLLEFADRQRLGWKTKATKSDITPGSTAILQSIEKELALYFDGKLKEFKTPLLMIGTPFQKRVWKELRKIPYGKTVSYAEIAVRIDHPTAYRAAALANGANPFTLVVPCHRVINANGRLGGYGGGISRKKWLLAHEK